MPPANPFQPWIGRERVATDTVGLERARKLAATLDRAPDALSVGDPLPRGWHWIYFHEPLRRSALAADGHERRGDFLPPVPLPRRMWAGGRLHFVADIPIGSEVQRTSTIRSVETKEGRSGRLAFVTVQHRLASPDGDVFVDEEQDIVYLERTAEPWSPPDPPPKLEPPEGARSRKLGTFTADEVALFRFSALTFNGHRIHFDRGFAREAEGYPDLVVHGPLVALLLLDAADRWAGEGAEDVVAAAAAATHGQVRFEYRGLQPAFCGETVELWGAAPGSGGASEGGDDAPGSLTLWAEHPARGVVTRAEWRTGSRM